MYHGPMTGRESGTIPSTTVVLFLVPYQPIANMSVQVMARWKIAILKTIQIYVTSTPLSLLSTMFT